MFEELPIIRMASALARNAGARHRVIAENVANADTPGYRARDVRPFAEWVNDPFIARATRPGHAQPPAHGPAAATVTDRTLVPGPNGNSVSLEAEMIKANEAQARHALATTVYRKAHELMRLGLGRR